MADNTIAERLQQRFDTFTRAERQLADVMLKNYPVSGLGTITTVAQSAGVSTPTVARMIQKLGFSGFPEFQAELRAELNATISSPIAKHDAWAGEAPQAHVLNRFTDAVLDNIRQTLALIDIARFDEACALLADEKRHVYIAGGRITRALADYLFLHLQVIRPGVSHIRTLANAWPHYLLDVKEGDVVIVFDIRRYEYAMMKLAEIAAEKGAKVVLFTDQWRSPADAVADFTFSSRIAVPSAWDSSVVTMLLVEAVIEQIQQHNWPSARQRMEALEGMFDRTRIFRKFT